MPTVPNLEAMLGDTNWGTVTQRGRDIEIADHPDWSAVGRIRDDGKVFLLWTDLRNGGACPSVYDVTEHGLQGLWGRGDEGAAIDATGNMTGPVRTDWVYKRPPPVPEV